MRSSIVSLAIISFAVGIAWQSMFKLSVTFVALLLMFVVVVVVLLSTHKKLLILSAITVSMLALGIVRMSISQTEGVANIAELAPQVGMYIDITGKIVAEPDTREYTINLVVQPERLNVKVLVKANTYGEYNYGDSVRIRGKLERAQNFVGDTGKEFDYVSYLAKDGIHYVVNRANVEVLANVERATVSGILFNLKTKYLQNIAQSIPEPESALAGGITVGAKRSMGKELLEQFRKTGVIHIVVSSGFNVAIVAMFFTYIFSFFGIKFGRALAVVGIILFAMLTGGGVTVIRASAMGILAIFALTARRKYIVTRALLVVAFFMLLYNPNILLYDISFQLSFVATLGMIFGMPILQRWLSAMSNILKFREILSATIATQIFVAPLLLYYMGELSVVSIVANVLVLPLVTLSMLLVFLTGVLGFVSVVVAVPFAYVAYVLLHGIIIVVQTLADMPHTTVGVSGFGLISMLVAYIAIMLWVLRFKSPRDDAPVYIV